MKLSTAVEKRRVFDGAMGSDHGDMFGLFLIPGPCTRELKVLVSNGTQSMPWEHVSVSARRHCPTWTEMCFVKDLFWGPEEAVMQLHPPASTYVNNHATCLHMWRPLTAGIPLPPEIAVGVKSVGLIGESPAEIEKARTLFAAMNAIAGGA